MTITIIILVWAIVSSLIIATKYYLDYKDFKAHCKYLNNFIDEIIKSYEEEIHRKQQHINLLRQIIATKK